MNPQGDGALLRVMEKGGGLCAEQLEKISRAVWSSAELSLNEAAKKTLERMMDTLSTDFYGSWFTASGAAFLIVIPRTCGMRLTNRFTQDHVETIDMLDQRESVALAEIANILVNSFVTALAEILDEDMIVSAPTPMLDCTRDLLIQSLSKHSRPDRYAIAGLARLASQAMSSDLSIIMFLEPRVLIQLRGL